MHTFSASVYGVFRYSCFPGCTHLHKTHILIKSSIAVQCARQKRILLIKEQKIKRFIHNETNGLDYELVGNYYLPCLKAPESPKVGRFGLLYLYYLRNHKKVTYSGLLLSGKLNEYVESIDRQAKEMFSRLVEKMTQAEGVTEQLKGTDQMAWVGAMNNIRNRAEEIVRQDLILT